MRNEKEILTTVGSNLTLKDKTLRIQAPEPFFILENVLNGDDHRTETFEPENIGLPQGQNEANATACPLERALREDIEAIFRDELQNFFVSKEKVKAHLASANGHLSGMKARLAAHTRQLEKVRAEMRKVYQLYQTDHVSPEGFGKLLSVRAIIEGEL